MEEVHFPEREIPVMRQSSDKSAKKDEKEDDKESENAKSTIKSKKSNPYSKPNEYDPVVEENNFYFKTDRVPWEKIMMFPPVVIESPERDLGCTRDTFRSAVNVRVVYLKVKFKNYFMQMCNAVRFFWRLNKVHFMLKFE